jgi:3-oxoacyl-[acyl-carrier protein] reductase
MSDSPLSGRVALVAGAGRGIGRDIAWWLSQSGADVVVCARRADGIDALAAEIRTTGRRVLAKVCDVADAAAVSALVDSAVAEFDRVDIAVANAAILGPVGTIDTVSHDEWLRTLEINVGGTAAVVRSVLPTMAKQSYGRILTLSGAGVGGPNLADRVSAYVASKGAVMVLTEAIAAELPPGVTINSIAPGAIPTGFMDEVLQVGPAVAGRALYDAVRTTAAPDLSSLRDLVLFLASDQAGGLSGRCLSARWDAPSVLASIGGTVAPSRYRLRRIDEDLYGDCKVSAQ